MSFGNVWRALLAITLGLVVGLLAFRLIDGAGTQEERPALSEHRPTGSFSPRLSLIRQAASGQLISLQIAPFQVGANRFQVTLLNPLGKPQEAASTHLTFLRMELGEVVGEVEGTPVGKSQQASFALDATGWWQIEVEVNGRATALFYLKLDQPSGAPNSFAPPDYESQVEAQELFQAALTRHRQLSGLKVKEELTSGERGPSGYGVWFVTNLLASSEGYLATTVNMESDLSQLYTDKTRQCFRQDRESWQCTDGPSPVGFFDLSYFNTATGFKAGGKEVADGELSQIVFFYNPPQSAWYAWWIGEETHLLRRQAMVANGHFMLDRFSDHDLPADIQPPDLTKTSR
jgi:hypothetical protein